MLRGRRGFLPFFLGWLLIAGALALVILMVLWFGGSLSR